MGVVVNQNPNAPSQVSYSISTTTDNYVDTVSTMGKGVLASSEGDPVPDVSMASTLIYSAVIASLKGLMGVVREDQKADLASVIDKLEQAQKANAVAKIKNDSEAQQWLVTKQKQLLEAAAKKIEEAKAKSDEADVFGWVKASFQVLGSVIAIGIGAALIATGVGAPLGCLMIAAGVVGLIMAVDEMVKLKTGMGLAGTVAFAMHHDEEEAKKADMGFSIAMAGVALLLAVGMFFVPGGQVSAVASVQEAMEFAQIIGQMTQVGTAVFSSGAMVGESVVNYQATNLQAEGTSMKSDAKKLEAVLSALDDLIDVLLGQVQDVSEKFNKIVNSLVEAFGDEGTTFAKSKFSA